MLNVGSGPVFQHGGPPGRLMYSGTSTSSRVHMFKNCVGKAQVLDLPCGRGPDRCGMWFVSWASMPRAPRLRIQGATYHVMARGNRKQAIFESERDRIRFLAILSDAVDRYDVLLLGYCLMGNHFHLVVVTPRGNISAFMRQVDGVFTQYSNWRYQRVGHLLQGPFKAVIVENDLHLLTALAYVMINPVEAGLVPKASGWRWSSFRATVGLSAAPSFLSIEWIDRLFPASSRAESQQRFETFMNGTPNFESYLDLNVPVVGSQAFRARIRSYVGEMLFKRDVPRSYKAIFRPSLDELFRDVQSKSERLLVIERAHVVHGYRLAEIARSLALHPASVSRILCSGRRAIRQSCRDDVGKRDLTPNSTSTGSGRGRGRNRGSSPRRR